jgi:hypothetical protein
MEQTNKSVVIIARFTSFSLLVSIGITALFGGAALIVDPSGQSMGLELEVLAGSLFDDYRAPGIILFLAIGVLSSSVALLIATNYKNYPLLIFYQGLIITGWIMAQIYLLTETHMLQAVYGLSGVMLILLGSYLILKRKDHLKTFY